MPREDYEDRKAARIERYEDRASAANSRSNAAYKASHAATAGIPMGQPILVGHHSEKRHRAALARSDAGMRKSIDESSKAAHYAGKASAAASNTAISSDDPEAIVKLKEKLADLETTHALDKRVNAAWRKFKKNPDSLDQSDIPDAWKNAIRNFKPEWSKDSPVPAYRLSNRNGNMKRIKDRIKELTAEFERADEGDKTTEYNGFEVVENASENRVQLIFPGKPSAEIRSVLKSHGFRWSRYNGAWQRQLNSSGRYAADTVAKLIEGN